MDGGVPRLIHQVFPHSDLPPKLTENVRKLRDLNPDWEYRFYNDRDIEDYLGKYFPEFLKSYLAIDPHYGVVRADLFRYLLMYREGGVYLDIKSFFSRPLSESTGPADCYILSHWPNQPGQDHESWGKHSEISNPHGEFQQCFIIATKGHPFLKAVLEAVLKNIDHYNPFRHGTAKYGVVRLSGPVAYTLAITPLLSRYEHRLVDSQADLGFVYSVLGLLGPESHFNTFKTHYTQLDLPIVSSGFKGWILARLYAISRIFRKKVPDYYGVMK